jgi:predicted SprT family Zn-dependent metalloprotease
MRGKGSYSVVAQNIYATRSETALHRLMARRFLLCWQCQTMKPQSGGKHSRMGRENVFVCKPCLEAIKARKESK